LLAIPPIGEPHDPPWRPSGWAPPAPDLALTLGQAVAGSSARAKARSIGIADDRDREAEKRDADCDQRLSRLRWLDQRLAG
jgi:hypothetical protein